MAAEALTPIDQTTGLPYIVLPTWPETTRKDWNHAFFPKRSDLLSGVGGNAVRHCRVQLTDYVVHHNLYHAEFYGTPLPQNEDDQFRTVVMAAAGNIPAFALSYENGTKAEIVPIDEKTRSTLWRNRQVRVEAPVSVRDFLRDYTLRKDRLDHHLSSLEVDEFLHTNSESRRKQLTHTLLAIASLHATDSLASMYRASWRNNQLPPDQTLRPHRFVARTIAGRYRYRDIALRLETILREVAA